MIKPRLARWGHIVLGLILVTAIILGISSAFRSGRGLRDFGSFVASGNAAANGQNPYGVYQDTYQVIIDGEIVAAPNLNPPISVYAFELISEINPSTAKLVLQISSLALYAAMMFALFRAHRENVTPMIVIWTFAITGLWHTVGLGQIYVLILAGVTGAWLLQPKHPALAGLLLGLVVAIKPAFLIWPALLFLSGDRKTSLSAAATAAGISLVPLLFEGPEIYRQWLTASSAFGGLEMPGNSSLIAITGRLGVPWLGLVASGLLLGGLAIWAVSQHPTRWQISAAAILGALILGPITWAGYSLFALPVLVSRRWFAWEWAAALLLCVPFGLAFDFASLNPVANILLGSIYGWGLLIAFGLLAADAYRRHRGRRDEPVAEVDLTAKPLAA